MNLDQAREVVISLVTEALENAGLKQLFWHEEEACFSGRFSKI